VIFCPFAHIMLYGDMSAIVSTNRFSSYNKVRETCDNDSIRD
jgi:hypothetical protein